MDSVYTKSTNSASYCILILCLLTMVFALMGYGGRQLRQFKDLRLHYVAGTMFSLNDLIDQLMAIRDATISRSGETSTPCAYFSTSGITSVGEKAITLVACSKKNQY